VFIGILDMETTKKKLLATCNRTNIPERIRTIVLFSIALTVCEIAVSQYSGVGVVDPSHAIHVRPQVGEDPVQIEGLNAAKVGDSRVHATNTVT